MFTLNPEKLIQLINKCHYSQILFIAQDNNIPDLFVSVM